MSFEAVFCCNESQTFDTLKDAAKWIIEKTKQKIKKGEMSLQILETGIWIQQDNYLPIFFYDIRDNAIDNGWIDQKGNWIE